MMRKLSVSFLQDFKSGFLSGLMARVHQDRDLDLEIREGYVNIYFKGNSLLMLVETRPNQYRVDVHPKFTGNTKFQGLTDEATTRLFLAQIPSIKENIILCGKSSLEIEYEQMIIRVNNYDLVITASILSLTGRLWLEKPVGLICQAFTGHEKAVGEIRSLPFACSKLRSLSTKISSTCTNR